MVDRDAAAKVLAAVPEVREMARENRAFLQRVVRYLVGEAGIRQIIDIGTGISTVGNVHEVAQEIHPRVRVAYVDNDRCKSGCAQAGPTRLAEAGQGHLIRESAPADSHRPRAARQGDLDLVRQQPLAA
jgi:hypothetical protein